MDTKGPIANLQDCKRPTHQAKVLTQTFRLLSKKEQVSLIYPQARKTSLNYNLH